MATLIHAMNHHAKDKVEVINALAVGFATELRPAGWDIGNVLGGAGSWYIHRTVNGKMTQYHFRNGGHGCIKVLDHYQAVALKRKPVVFLRTRVDVIRWVSRIA